MEKELEVYIHIPFCVKKCAYCDFLSAPYDDNTKAEYIEALINEIRLYAGSNKKIREYCVTSVFIGGGTPSILAADFIVDILRELRKCFNLKNDAEITIECNPGTVTREKLFQYRKAGINRISVGLQSADNKELKYIGRIHTYEDFIQSYNDIRDAGFENVNVDLMSALPGQSVKSYRNTLQKVLSLTPMPEHISAYSLIVEEGTLLEKIIIQAKDKNEDILPSEYDERIMYYDTKKFLEDAGYEHYEISNYAKSGYECKHNCGYWMRKNYIGFGIGAASLMEETRWNNIKDINKYIRTIRGMLTHSQLNIIHENEEKLSIKDQMEEFMFLGLRMIQGVSRQDFIRKFGRTYESVYDGVNRKMVSAGLIEDSGDNIKLTSRGIDVGNYVFSEFIL
ncbi:MAG: radical SAM family heme chaperone HemW [Eubacterium sp.]